MPGKAEKSQSDRRAEIIRIATDLFLENGFSGTSMNTVAQACGMTKASLYHHFKGKDELFAACVTDGYRDALITLEAIVHDASLTPPQKIKKAMDCLYAITITSPAGRMSPLIAEVSSRFPSVAKSFHEDYIQPQNVQVEQIVAQGVASGDFRDVDQKVLSHMMFGPIVTLSLSREMFASFDDLDTHFPIETLRQGHEQQILAMLLKSPA